VAAEVVSSLEFRAEYDKLPPDKQWEVAWALEEIEDDPSWNARQARAIAPAEMANELGLANLFPDESPRGQYLFRVFAAGLIPDGAEEAPKLGEILADYLRDAAEWTHGTQ
jgi:hypothetical protein